jgi:rhodanese-related sulfurtransferase
MKEDAKRQKQELRGQERRTRRTKVFVGTAAAIAVAAFTLSSFLPAAGSSSSDRATPPAGFHRMTIDELKPQFDRGEIIVIDVRDQADFLQSHIPGALQIPLSRIEGEISYLPKGKPIVTYCTCPSEESSGQAAQILERGGIPRVAALQGGFQEWSRRGYPTASGSL